MALGPYYDYSNELKYPSEFLNNSNGTMRDGDIFTGPPQIEKNVRGVKYYVDAIAFGNSVPFPGTGADDSMKQAPMGLRYFFNTGMTCSNGADMYQYMNMIPDGLPAGMGAGLKKKLGSNLQGLAPGALQDSFDATGYKDFYNIQEGGYVNLDSRELDKYFPEGFAGELDSEFQDSNS